MIGSPPTTYVNASLIAFPGLKQSFLAVQSPRVNTFDNFWQMVVEKKVTTIVMITGLVEGRRVKADKYWPDAEDDVKKLSNGITIR